MGVWAGTREGWAKWVGAGTREGGWGDGQGKGWVRWVGG